MFSIPSAGKLRLLFEKVGPTPMTEASRTN